MESNHERPFQQPRPRTGLERRVLRAVLKALWALISSIGLVIFGPWLALFVLGIFSGNFDLGTTELLLPWLCWLMGIPTVAVLWYRKYLAGPSR